MGVGLVSVYTRRASCKHATCEICHRAVTGSRFSGLAVHLHNVRQRPSRRSVRQGCAGARGSLMLRASTAARARGSLTLRASPAARARGSLTLRASPAARARGSLTLRASPAALGPRTLQRTPRKNAGQPGREATSSRTSWPGVHRGSVLAQPPAPEAPCTRAFTWPPRQPRIGRSAAVTPPSGAWAQRSLCASWVHTAPRLRLCTARAAATPKTRSPPRSEGGANPENEVPTPFRGWRQPYARQRTPARGLRQPRKRGSHLIPRVAPTPKTRPPHPVPRGCGNPERGPHPVSRVAPTPKTRSPPRSEGCANPRAGRGATSPALRQSRAR
jgi:hypothetical protein